MQKVYEIGEPTDDEHHYGYVDGNHGDGGLPGVFCHGCGSSWSMYGLAYPAFDPSIIDNYRELLQARNVTVPYFNEIRDTIAPLLPPGTFLPPGTNFGPISGVVHGKLADFTWIEGALLIRQELYTAMAESDLKLPPAFPTRLIFSPKVKPVDILELGIPTVACLSDTCVEGGAITPCEVCGRAALTIPWGEIILRAESIPDNLDLFRVRETLTEIATEPFVRFCKDNRLRNIQIVERAII